MQELACAASQFQNLPALWNAIAQEFQNTLVVIAVPTVVSVPLLSGPVYILHHHPLLFGQLH